MIKNAMLAVVAAGSLAFMASGASAATFPSFVFDEEASTIELTSVGGGCVPGDCTLKGGFAAGATDYTFSPTFEGEMDYLADFINWEIALEDGKECVTFGFFKKCFDVGPTGGGLYDVVVNLVFSDPDVASSGATGTAGFATILGSLSGGFLSWDDGGEGTIEFAQGSVLGFNLKGTLVGGLGTKTTTGVKFTAVELQPIPLPAAGWMLLAGVGGLVAMKRRRKAA